MNLQKNSRKKGFTLIELAIVLTVMGLMMGGALLITGMQIRTQQIETTRDRLNAIRDAIQLYYETYGHLPCPADIDSFAESEAGFGEIDYDDPVNPNNATCNHDSPPDDIDPTLANNVYYGMVPTVELELPIIYSYDAWNTRFTYAVSRYCVDLENWGTDSPEKCAVDGGNNIIDATDTTPGGNITIKSTLGSNANITTKAAYIVISHGSNRGDGYTRSGNLNDVDLTGLTNELENADFSADAIFHDGNIFDPDNGTTDYFDDMTVWKTAPQIQYEADN